MPQVSLSGAAGSLSAMGEKGPLVRAALAEALGLSDPGASWHSERDGIASFAAWMATTCTCLAKMAEDLNLLTQSGIDEVVIAGAGGSSTMPQKQNPVGPSVLVAIARQATALAGVVQGAGVHRQQRDGAAWYGEWLSLPQMGILTGRALALAGDLVPRLTPDPRRHDARIGRKQWRHLCRSAGLGAEAPDAPDAGAGGGQGDVRRRGAGRG